MQKYPERKKYIFTIPTIKGDVSFKLQQDFAERSLNIYEMYRTLIETNDIFIKVHFAEKLNSYYKTILQDNVVYTDKKRKINKRLKLIYTNIGDYETTLLKMLHPIRQSLYEWKEIAKPKRYKKVVFGGWDNQLYKETGIPLDQIDKRLTLEQKCRWYDKLLFDYYDTFDNGKRVNSIIRGEQWITDREQQLLDHMNSYGTWD